MKPTSIAHTLLAPNYNIPTIATVASNNSTNNSSALLLGQHRVIDAYKLLQGTIDQQMFLIPFTGLNIEAFIAALTAEHGSRHPNQALWLASDKQSCYWQSCHYHKELNETQHSKDIQLEEQLHSVYFLNGDIKRTDLIGKVTINNDSSISYKAGFLANCQTLFIDIDSLWKRAALWELLLTILAQRSFQVHHSLPVIPLQCKIVLVGTSSHYSQCYQQESRFPNLFPLLGEMVNEVARSTVDEQLYSEYLLAVAKLAKVELTDTALAPLFSFSARLCEHQQRLSLQTTTIKQLLEQAAVYNQSAQVDDKAIINALAKQTQRHNTSERYSAQGFDDKFIHLATTGSKVGQVNGLTVIDTVEYSYGEPARITAAVHYGDGEVADIERKSELAGNIHAKGMMILSSCLYRIFGKDAPLHLNANIVFEQSYQEIDGDSASLAEYCCLISAITEKPISQGIAVTGAIDQFGSVQAIGGVNEKIEGFFNLCQRRGLDGKQGVIIPQSNIQQLNLPTDIIEAVKMGQFTLYSVTHIDEAVSQLMGVTAGTADQDNNFAADSLYGLVQQRLANLAGFQEERSFYEKLREKIPFFS